MSLRQEINHKCARTVVSLVRLDGLTPQELSAVRHGVLAENRVPPRACVCRNFLIEESSEGWCSVARKLDCEQCFTQ
jgi:hypothetical protein